MESTGETDANESRDSGVTSPDSPFPSSSSLSSSSCFSPSSAFSPSSDFPSPSGPSYSSVPTKSSSTSSSPLSSVRGVAARSSSSTLIPTLTSSSSPTHSRAFLNKRVRAEVRERRNSASRSKIPTLKLKAPVKFPRQDVLNKTPSVSDKSKPEEGDVKNDISVVETKREERTASSEELEDGVVQAKEENGDDHNEVHTRVVEDEEEKREKFHSMPDCAFETKEEKKDVNRAVQDCDVEAEEEKNDELHDEQDCDKHEEIKLEPETAVSKSCDPNPPSSPDPAESRSTTLSVRETKQRPKSASALLAAESRSISHSLLGNAVDEDMRVRSFSGSGVELRSHASALHSQSASRKISAPERYGSGQRDDSPDPSIPLEKGLLSPGHPLERSHSAQSLIEHRDSNKAVPRAQDVAVAKEKKGLMKSRSVLQFFSGKSGEEKRQLEERGLSKKSPRSPRDVLKAKLSLGFSFGRSKSSNQISPSLVSTEVSKSVDCESSKPGNESKIDVCLSRDECDSRAVRNDAFVSRSLDCSPVSASGYSPNNGDGTSSPVPSVIVSPCEDVWEPGMGSPVSPTEKVSDRPSLSKSRSEMKLPLPLESEPPEPVEETRKERSSHKNKHRVQKSKSSYQLISQSDDFTKNSSDTVGDLEASGINDELKILRKIEQESEAVQRLREALYEKTKKLAQAKARQHRHSRGRRSRNHHDQHPGKSKSDPLATESRAEVDVTRSYDETRRRESVDVTAWRREVSHSTDFHEVRGAATCWDDNDDNEDDTKGDNRERLALPQPAPLIRARSCEQLSESARKLQEILASTKDCVPSRRHREKHRERRDAAEPSYDSFGSPSHSCSRSETADTSMDSGRCEKVLAGNLMSDRLRVYPDEPYSKDEGSLHRQLSPSSLSSSHSDSDRQSKSGSPSVFSHQYSDVGYSVQPETATQTFAPSPREHPVQVESFSPSSVHSPKAGNSSAKEVSRSHNSDSLRLHLDVEGLASRSRPEEDLISPPVKERPDTRVGRKDVLDPFSKVKESKNAKGQAGAGIPPSGSKKKSSSRVDVLLNNDLFKKHLGTRAEELRKRAHVTRRLTLKKSVSNLDLSMSFEPTAFAPNPKELSGDLFKEVKSRLDKPEPEDLPSPRTNVEKMGIRDDRNSISSVSKHSRRNSLSCDDPCYELMQHRFSQPDSDCDSPRDVSESSEAAPSRGGEKAGFQRRYQRRRRVHIPSFHEFKRQRQVFTRRSSSGSQSADSDEGDQDLSENDDVFGRPLDPIAEDEGEPGRQAATPVPLLYLGETGAFSVSATSSFEDPTLTDVEEIYPATEDNSCDLRGTETQATLVVSDEEHDTPVKPTEEPAQRISYKKKKKNKKEELEDPTLVLRSTSDVSDMTTSESQRKRRDRRERQYKSDPLTRTENLPEGKAMAATLGSGHLVREELIHFLEDVYHGQAGSPLSHPASCPSLEELQEESSQSESESGGEERRRSRLSNVSSASEDSGVAGQDPPLSPDPPPPPPPPSGPSVTARAARTSTR